MRVLGLSRVLGAGVAVTLCGIPVSAAEQQGDSIPTLLAGGWLFDGTRDTLIPNPGIVMIAGKIAAVGPAVLPERVIRVTVPAQATILPGFFDLHAHYAVDLFDRGRVDDTTAYPALFLANGVTSTFPAGEMDPEKMRRLRLAIDRGDRIGPRILNSGPYFGSWRPGWSRTMTGDSIAREVAYWAERGVRGFKAKGISGPQLQALIEAAHRYGLSVTGHLDSGFRGSVNPADAIRMGIDRVEHFLGGEAFPADRSAYRSLESLDPDTPAVQAIIHLYLERHVFFDATLTAYGYYGAQDPEVFSAGAEESTYLTPFMQEEIRRRPARTVNEQFERIYWIKRKTVKAFYDAGGGDLITLGTDHPSWGQFLTPFAVHRELHALVLSGIPPAAALRIATINGARAMGVGDRFGTVEAGKIADLVVVRGNPLQDITVTRQVIRVFKGGVSYDAVALRRGAKGTLGPRDASDISAWVRP